jgi:peptide/nickel transport system substrate-binding protein
MKGKRDKGQGKRQKAKSKRETGYARRLPFPFSLFPFFPLSLLPFAFALLTPACTPALPPTDTVVVTLTSSPATFDPRIGTDDVSQKLFQVLYTNLFNLDEQLRMAPGLGTHWETPNDTTYVVHLRKGVQFHDGHELTAADVVYTFRSFIDPAFSSPRKGAYTMVDAVVAQDPLTVEFRLKKPFGSFPVNFVMPVVPEGADATLGEHPIGTGPYRFVSHAADDRVELEAFPEYFEGAPRSAKLLFKVVPDDIMRALELRKGTADLVVNDIAPDVVYQLGKDPRLRVTEAPGIDYQYLGLNLRDPALSDVRVRHAIGHAIDREAIVRYLRRGLAVPAVGVLPPASWAFEPDVFSFTHDPERAKRLLDEAGYRDPDGPGGRPRLKLSLKVSSVEFNRLQSSVIQQDLQQVGIEVDVRSYEFATFYADVLKGSFQMFTLQWVGVSDPDMLRRVFHSQQVPPIGFNRGFYQNPDVDRLIDAATVSTDDTERRRLYGDVQRLIARDAPYISLWYKTNVAVSRASLQGVSLRPAADFLFLKDVRKLPDAMTAR